MLWRFSSSTTDTNGCFSHNPARSIASWVLSRLVRALVGRRGPISLFLVDLAYVTSGSICCAFVRADGLCLCKQTIVCAHCALKPYIGRDRPRIPMSFSCALVIWRENTAQEWVISLKNTSQQLNRMKTTCKSSGGRILARYVVQ